MFAATALASCGGVGDGGGGVACDFVQPSGAGFAGTALYQDKLYDKNGFTQYRWAPVRYAQVELRNGATVMKTGLTDASGNFCLVAAGVPANANLTVRLKAVAEPPGVVSPDTGRQSKVVVADPGIAPTLADPERNVFYLETGPVTARKGEIVSVGALPVYEAADQNIDRMLHPAQGGAFNILDVALGGFRFVERTWARDLPDLQVTWRQDAGGGTYFAGKVRFGSAVDTINIKGETLSDSDEYDDDIVLHEFGHFALSRLSDDNSPGGTHYINGSTQDARLAWSEGWANFFSALVRDTDPNGFSNRTGSQATIVDAFTKTIGSQRQVRFSYELLTPQAYLPDTADPLGLPQNVARNVFQDLAKHGTSEVSVAVALWDVYKGDDTGQNRWNGVGAGGMLQVIEAIPGLLDPGGWEAITFTEFWKAYGGRFPDQADGIRAHLQSDRLMSMVDDEWGADDTPADMALLVPPYTTRHEFTNMAPGDTRIQRDHTLFPEGDADLFRLHLAQGGKYRITTLDARDGVDTVLELLHADGVTPVLDGTGNPVLNDNYNPYRVTLSFPTDNGVPLIITREWLNYGGDCGIQSIQIPAFGIARVSNCPPNAANPPPTGIARWPEHLTSQVTADLTAVPGTGTEYFIRVTRSAQAPPSAGKYGTYSLKVEGLP
ncbi:MAG: hypothetical protein HZA24_06870 [Nitrospirae bacterium]|nr:hypothetical protein [Nitrospirota bacterium]